MKLRSKSRGELNEAYTKLGKGFKLLVGWVLILLFTGLIISKNDVFSVKKIWTAGYDYFIMSWWGSLLVGAGWVSLFFLSIGVSEIAEHREVTSHKGGGVIYNPISITLGSGALIAIVVMASHVVNSIRVLLSTFKLKVPSFIIFCSRLAEDLAFKNPNFSVAHVVIITLGLVVIYALYYFIMRSKILDT